MKWVDVLWFHIRGVGGWTNKLYEYFKREQIKQENFQSSFRPALPLVSSYRSELQPNLQPIMDESVINSAEQKSSPEFTRTRIPYRYDTCLRVNHFGFVLYCLFSPQVSIPLSEVSANESVLGAQTVRHTGYRYMRHPPEVINLPVPVEDPRDTDLSSAAWKKWSKKKNPRDSFSTETLRSRRAKSERKVEENVTDNSKLFNAIECEINY